MSSFGGTGDTFDPSQRNDEVPPFAKYAAAESFFEGEAPLSQAVGYTIILGFGIFFSLVTTIFFHVNNHFGAQGARTLTSEHFNTAGRMVKTGLTASVVVSQWTWAATLLQSSNVAWAYGVSGPFWYASGATVQIILFGVLSVSIKKNAPSAHTVCEIVHARWGRYAHQTFLFFCLAANIIVTSMLLLGGAATVEALTGVDYRVASFLIPWGVIVYTASGGLQATFLASYFHTTTIFVILITMVFTVYVKDFSSDALYTYMTQTVSYTNRDCRIIFSEDGSPQTSFYEPGRYACGPVDGNRDGSYLTMISEGGLLFGIINVVGNFGTVFVDQSYWQSAIAARPSAAAKGYMLAGLCWFSIPFCLASSLGLVATALQLPITDAEASSGLVPPAVATELLGDIGSVLILVMLFMAIVSTGSSESIAVSSLVAYDIYRQYYNPNATGEDILYVSRVVIVGFGLVMGALSIALFELGLDLGWVYLFMGIIIGPAVAPLWNLMRWEQASGTGAIVAAWAGLVLGLAAWMFAAMYQSAELTVESLGTNEVMLTGNLMAILSSAFIHWAYSRFADPQNYDFGELETHISLVEKDDLRGLTRDQRDPIVLSRYEQWITRRGYVLTFVLLFAWPMLSIPAGIFSRGYFAFWVSISIAWGFSSAVVIIVLPILESFDDIRYVAEGVYDKMTCQNGRRDVRREAKREMERNIRRYQLEHQDSLPPDDVRSTRSTRRRRQKDRSGRNLEAGMGSSYMSGEDDASESDMSKYESQSMRSMRAARSSRSAQQQRTDTTVEQHNVVSS